MIEVARNRNFFPKKNAYLHFLQLVRDPVMSHRPPVLHLNVVRLFSPRTYRLKKALQLKQQTAP